jgi:hypothetical protein
VTATGPEAERQQQEQSAALAEWTETFKAREAEWDESLFELSVLFVCRDVVGLRVVDLVLDGMTGARQFEAKERIRFSPLGTDLRGNTYFVMSPLPGVAPPPVSGDSNDDDGHDGDESEEEERDHRLLLSWNVLVHGPGCDDDADAKDKRGGKERTASSSSWYGFAEPDQVVKLASWIEYQGKLAEFEVSSSKRGQGKRDGEGEQQHDLAGLATGLREWADWRWWWKKRRAATETMTTTTSAAADTADSGSGTRRTRRRSSPPPSSSSSSSDE